jgi:N-acyl-D-amino-acid deacylase
MSRPKSRRRFLEEGSRGLLGLAALRAGRVEAAFPFDVVLKGGTILDGTGQPGFPADVGIVGDTIKAVEPIAASQASRVVDVSGLHVCPGFIDIHSHSDPDVLAYPSCESRAYQGVTTELAGNCGGSAAPLAGLGAAETRRGHKEQDIDADWGDVASYLARLDKSGISVNQGLLLGQGTIRDNAIGSVDRQLTADELAGILRVVEEGMEQGAFGMSTGLEYIPGQYTPTDEIVAMARIVGRYGGLYASHTRNEESMLLEAVNECIDIGRRSGARVEISHLKAAGKPYWNKQAASLDLIEAARREGVEVLADAYPYTAYSTSLTIFLDAWVHDGGAVPMMARLKDKAQRERIRKEVDARVPKEPGGYELIVISRVRTQANRGLVGKNMREIAEAWKVKPVDALLRVIEEESGSVSYVGHGMSPENVEMVLRHPLVMVGSDGVSMAPTGKAAETRPHPRSYGCFPRVLGHYCRERQLFDLPTAVRKMTSMPADQIGIRDRGRVARGRKADLVAFDAASVKDVATFDDPHRYPTGVVHVFVNGEAVVEKGRHTGARPGRALRRT